MRSGAILCHCSEALGYGGLERLRLRSIQHRKWTIYLAGEDLALHPSDGYHIPKLSFSMNVVDSYGKLDTWALEHPDECCESYVIPKL